MIWDVVPDFLKPKKDSVDDDSALVKNDFKLEFKDIVEENGFIFEEHSTVTNDGYIIEIFRIKN